MWSRARVRCHSCLRRCHRLVLAALADVALSALECLTPAWASWSFTEVHESAALVYEHRYDATPSAADWSAGGVAAGDYDGDGWVDLYVVRGDAGANLLFRNRGDGTFEEVGARAGVDLAGARSTGPTFADFDGDGHLDLLVLALLCPNKVSYCDGVQKPQTGTVKLFRNRGDGTFTDVTAQSGLRFTRDSFSAAWGDYDLDGDLDLFVTHWGDNRPPGSSEHLWRNNGDGTFTDVSVSLGITAAYAFVTGDIGDLSFTPNFADIDSDGWPDLLVAGDFLQSKVFRNVRGTAFVDATTPVISDENGMGAAVGDYDNDGHLDWFVSSIWDPDQDNRGNNWYVSGNRLYRNRGDGTFEDVTTAAGVREGYWGWAATFADLDNDGWLDLYHVNGWRTDDPNATEFHSDPAVLFHNQRDGTFAEIAAATGVADRGQGRGVVAFDYDRDGDVDLFIANIQGPPALYRNDLPRERRFVNVQLRGRGNNRQGIGARIWVETNGFVQMRELRAGSNFVSQDPAEAHFGLGTATRVDRLRVRWTNGRVQEWRDLPSNSWIVADEGEEALRIRPLAESQPTAPPTPTFSPTPSTTAAQSVPTPTPTPTPQPCTGDCSGDGEVTIEEIVRLVAIALGEAAPTTCPVLQSAGVVDVTIDYIVRAVNAALNGCTHSSPLTAGSRSDADDRSR